MDSLKKAFEAKNIVFVLGSGISASITSGQPTSTWEGLIESGIARAKLVNARCDDAWETMVRSLLGYGLGKDDANCVVQSAGMVSKAIRDINLQAFSNWLQDDIGKLLINDRSTARVLLAFPFPILTTNYDTLLEDISGRASANWSNSKATQQILAGSTNAIGHLHGVWNDPESIIMSESDYSSILSAAPVQGLQRGALSIKSIVFIGYGQGLNDPNLTNLLDWYRRTFPDSGIPHFRLCLESEVDSLTRIHAGDSIHPIAYGKEFSDLPKFLKGFMPELKTLSITPAGIARDLIGELQQSWADNLKSDSVIAEIVGEEDRTPEDLLVPPVLLPVPYSEYVRAKNSKNKSDRIERLDPDRETQEADVILIVGEDGAGLTTALRWMTWKASIHLESAVLFYVNFKNCKKGEKSLQNQLKTLAKPLGLLPNKNSELPAYILALDDYAPFVDGISDNVIEHLASNEAIFTVIGCKKGYEDEILTQFRRVGITARVRYLGQLDSSDIKQLAKFASPGGHRKLAENVITILRSENFTRTPFTASLLIAILLRGGTVTSNASQTAILEEYVSNLLGRGNPHEDARLGVDQPGREVLLASLAQHFVETSSSGLSETDLLLFFASVFERFGWTESPSLMLKNLLEIRILRKVGTYIQFARNSYLYLFAAKRAKSENDFRLALSNQPLFYAQILKSYSALTRNDEDLLFKVDKLLDGISSQVLDKGSPYQQLELHQATGFNDLDLDEKSNSSPEDYQLAEETEVPFSSLDRIDEELPPFPGERDTDLPFTFRLVRSLDLVSTVLRDSDQIENLDLKRTVLIRALEGWGTLISALNDDKIFQDLMSQITEEIIKAIDGPSSKYRDTSHQEKLKQEVLRTIPAAISLGGIQSTLASRKLIASFDQALITDGFGSSEETAIAAAFFLFVLKEKGWAAKLHHILMQQGNIWIISVFLFGLCADAYVSGMAIGEDEEDLLNLCLEILERSTQYDSSEHRISHLDANRTSLKKQRLQIESKAKAQRLAIQ